MKIYKIVLIILITTLILSSCGKDEEKLESKKTSINNQLVAKIKNMGVKQKSSGLKKGELKYYEDKEKLYIGANTEIIPSSNNSLPKGVTIYKDYKTYDNSNNSQYTFFVADSSDTVEMISDYYTKLFKTLGYKRIGDIPKEQSKFLDKLEFQLGEEIIIPEGDLSPEELEKLQNREPIIKVKININSITPDNIVNGMGLSGTFVEIYYSIY